MDELELKDIDGDLFDISMHNGCAYTGQRQYSVELTKLDMVALRDWLTAAITELENSNGPE